MVKLLENTGFNKLGLKRIEILVAPQNAASERVAIKCGYAKEGTMRKALKIRNSFLDCLLYARVKYTE